MATVKEVKLMKDGAMVTPLTLIDSLKNLDGSKYKDTVTNLLAGKANSSHDHNDKYYTKSEIDTKVSTLNTSINGKAPKSDGKATTTTSTYTLPSMSVGQVLVFNVYSGNPDEDDNFHDIKLPSGGTYVVATNMTNTRGKTVNGGTVVGDSYNNHWGVVVRIS